MPQHAEIRWLPYTPEQLFQLVIDIEKYPEFLPWCAAARVREHGDRFIRADLAIGYKIFRETFTSRVTYSAPYEIQVSYQDGPFKYLRNHWVFKPKTHDGIAGCDVDFFLDFEFRSKLLESAMQIIFTKAVMKMVEAFEARAAQLYPSRPRKA